MQADQRRGSSRRRRRRIEVCSQLLLPAVAAAGLCISGSRVVANAFVPPSAPRFGPRRPFRHNLRVAVPQPSTLDSCSPSESNRQRCARMVLGESPSAVCRRALQRAWQASSSEATLHEMNESQLAAADARGLDLRLTTFNLLAPCYKRMHGEVSTMAAMVNNAATGMLASQAKTRQRTARESEFASVWRERALETVEFIQREMLSSDIICLQEFWFDPEYEAIFRSALGDTYEFHTVKRTGGKSDGVAVLLRRGKWDVRSSVGMSLSAVGDRIALVMHLRSVRDDASGGREGWVGEGEESAGVIPAGGEDMILVNTHLAFPHNALDRANQMSQIEAITKAVEGLVSDAGLPTMTPRVVVGDLNVEETDPVCKHLGTNGFRSAFASLHREQRVITHRNHRGEEVMVDHVFVKAPGFAGRGRGDAAPVAAEIPSLVARLHEDVSVEEAMLLPGGVDTASWSPRFFLSDHRPLTVRLKFPAE